MISENLCRGQLQTLIMWLLSADCAPPACATEDSMRLVPGWQSADTALPRDVAGRAWAAGSRTVSGSGGADAVALALCVAEDSSELWGVCLPQLALPQDLLWAAPFFHIIVFRAMAHKGRMPIRQNEGRTEKARWNSDPCWYSNFDSSLIYYDVKSV